MIFLVWLVVFVVALTLYLREVYSRFSRYGVNYIKPLPFLGNAGNLALKKCHVAEDARNLYNAYPNDRFVGRFELLRPVVMIKDLDLIKQITIKDFEYFLDHRRFVDETVDPLFGRNLFSLRGQEWKDMRSTLSPAFTGSKMRAMVPFMVDVNKQMIKVLMEKILESKSGYIDLEGKDLTTRYTNDVIASCAFGVKVDSHTETDNEFYQHGKSTAHFGFRRILVYLGYTSFPSLMKKLNMKFFSEESSYYFRDLFTNTISERESNSIIRPDMIHLLLEAKKGNLKHEERVQSQDAGFATAEESELGKRTVKRSWTDTDLIAQAFLFFVAGFETVSSAMSFLLHELAVNPDVQEKLANEIRENDAKNNGVFDYNSVQGLKYLDMVISEVLRLWPPAIGLDRVCSKTYNMGKPNSKAKSDFIIREGESILIPVWSIHRDPNYYPNPDKFDPERFSDENKGNINPLTFIPFGTGPRNCIGSRFALSELKVMIYQVFLKLEVSPCEKTRIPIKLSTSAFTLAAEGGIWVRFSPRK